MSLYFVPANRQNLELSIEQDVPPERLAPFVPDDVIRELQDRAGMEGIRCWAMTPTKRSIFDAMQPGDIVLMSEKGTRRFTHCAQVTFKLENKALGDTLWPIRPRGPSRCSPRVSEKGRGRSRVLPSGVSAK